MVEDWQKNLNHIESISNAIQFIWKELPLTKPENMKHINTLHDIWDWCDDSRVNFDNFERDVSMYMLTQLSKINCINLAVSNGHFVITSISDQITFSGTNLIMSLAELIKLSENIQSFTNEEKLKHVV